jgi:hypothetical protein
MVSSHQNTAAPTGDEGVAGTFLRRGVAATQWPISEFGLKASADRHRQWDGQDASATMNWVSSVTLPGGLLFSCG